MRLLTIGQLAGYAGVTVKAVRHYHARGLLAEPPRDSSGYRRYDAQHAIQLVKIKTLAEAGVPLARIRELLTAGPPEFAEAIAEIDGGLRRQAARIEQCRERIAQLRGGDRLFVSAPVADYLDRLRTLGVSERSIVLERDVWVLLQAVSPAEAAGWIEDKLVAIEDPEFQALCLGYDAALDWPPEDPRLPALNERARRWLAAHDSPVEDGPRPDPVITRLAVAGVAASSSAWKRLGGQMK